MQCTEACEDKIRQYIPVIPPIWRAQLKMKLLWLHLLLILKRSLTLMKEYIMNQKTVGKRIQCLSDNENNINLLLRLTDTGFNNLLELRGITVKHGLLQDLIQLLNSNHV